MPNVHTHNAADDHLRRRALAESRRQVAVEAAQRQYHQAARAERTLYDATVAAAKHRLAKAEQPLEFVPEHYLVGTDETIDAALAEVGATRAAVERLGGAPDHRDLTAVRDRAVHLADQIFNAALAAGFPE